MPNPISLTPLQKEFLVNNLPMKGQDIRRFIPDVVGPSWVTWPGADVHVVLDGSVAKTLCGKQFWMSDPFLLVNPARGTPCPNCCRDLELPSLT